jgi:hypothetical protein
MILTRLLNGYIIHLNFWKNLKCWGMFTLQMYYLIFCQYPDLKALQCFVIEMFGQNERTVEGIFKGNIIRILCKAENVVFQFRFLTRNSNSNLNFISRHVFLSKLLKVKFKNHFEFKYFRNKFGELNNYRTFSDWIFDCRKWPRLQINVSK